MKRIIMMLGFMIVVLFPTSALAVDFTISKVKINAYLQSNGNVEVVEQHTYEFDSKFNGITRELIPKKGSTITEFEAFENSKPLKVELKEDEYRVHRKGKNETIVVELRYEIVNGIEKYEDGAQFYWPFFDQRNEADYGDMTIAVHPPLETADVLFLGYDAAYEKGELESGGIITFKMGDVSSGENGDIRVVYDAGLFPNVEAQSGLIRDEIIAERNQLAEDIVVFTLNQEKTRNYGIGGMAAVVVLLLGIFGTMLKRRRQDKLEVLHEWTADKFTVPAEKMSMPATVHYTNGRSMAPEVMAAGLLDLVRKGYVKQHSDDEFEVIDRDVEHTHESELIGLLFDSIGDGVHFELENLETYTKNKKNHGLYNAAVLKWRRGIMEEVKEQSLDGKSGGIRLLLIIISLSLVVGAILFGRYALYFFMVNAIILSLSTMIFAIFYKPRNLQGHHLVEEWRHFRKVFSELSVDEWQQLSTDDKFRAYTYAVGIGDKDFAKNFTEFASAGRRTLSEGPDFYYTNPALMTSSFTSANTNATPVSSGSGSSSSGGTGGGGGGSGAF